MRRGKHIWPDIKWHTAQLVRALTSPPIKLWLETAAWSGWCNMCGVFFILRRAVVAAHHLPQNPWCATHKGFYMTHFGRRASQGMVACCVRRCERSLWTRTLTMHQPLSSTDMRAQVRCASWLMMSWLCSSETQNIVLHVATIRKRIGRWQSGLSKLCSQKQ